LPGAAGRAPTGLVAFLTYDRTGYGSAVGLSAGALKESGAL